MNLLLVALGGAVGASARYLISTALNNLFSSQFFILGTLAVNVIGCFLIGLFYAFAKHYQFLADLRLLLVVGFLGAFTTFSSISYESLQLLKNAGFYSFSINIIINLFFGLIATYLALNYIK